MENKPNKKPGSANKNVLFTCLIIAVVLYLLYGYMKDMIEESTNKEISYSTFMQMVENKEVESVLIKQDRIEITPVKKTNNSGIPVKYYTGCVLGIVPSTNFETQMADAGVQVNVYVPKKSSGFFELFVVWIAPILSFGLVLFLIYRMMNKSGGGMMGVGKSNAKVYVEKQTGVTFKDVAGQEEAKESLTELVDFLHNPAKYTRIGAKLPKGALLVGPPGTGKTLLAKAVAGEAKVPFFSLSGSDFVEMFVGVGASRVRDLFKQAQQNAPCIIFIDEVDAIGKSRDSRYGGGNDEREQTLNQLLSEMDGFDTSKGLVILAATNRPEVLDKALLRPGRFDRRVIVDKPDLKGRIDILKVHAKNVLMHDSVDLEAIALATSGAVGSDLANIINEAAILAVKEGRTVVTQADLFESVEVVIAGKEKKDRILGKEEKRIVAYHEVGHALVTALQKNAEPVQKITIVPRTMGSLGYVMQVPEEEKYLMSKEELLTRIVTLYGGRAAESIVFDSITTGASNDIEKATSLARAMVTQYGMTERFGLMGLESVENQYLDGRPVMHCGEATASEIDKEVMAILKECYDKAIELLSANREILDQIADHLYEKETITGKEFMEIYHRVRGDEVEETKVEEVEETRVEKVESVDEVSKEQDVQEEGLESSEENKDINELEENKEI